jgi:hypothetical protein
MFSFLMKMRFPRQTHWEQFRLYNTENSKVTKSGCWLKLNVGRGMFPGQHSDIWESDEPMLKAVQFGKSSKSYQIIGNDLFQPLKHQNRSSLDWPIQSSTDHYAGLYVIRLIATNPNSCPAKNKKKLANLNHKHVIRTTGCLVLLI